jgi:hypothetical protein
MITMLERETDIIIQILTERTIGSARSLALKDALATDMPRAVKLYLRCEVTRLMEQDLRNAGHFSNLKFTAPLVYQLTKTYTRTLAPEYIFTREEFAALLENAVHFVENYLCRPQWTLTHFLFEKSERVTLDELQSKFEYISEYLYYGKLVEGFLQQKGRQEIEIGDFRSLLAKIDDQIVKQHNPRELAQLTRPMYEFLLLQSEIAEKPIPIKPLIVFFEDKKMSGLKEYIERICQIRKSEQLTIEQLADIIDDLYNGTSVKSKPNEEGNTSPGIHIEQQASPESALQREPEAARVETPAPVEAPQVRATIPGGDRRNIALSLTFSGMTESSESSPASSPLQDLKTAIGEQQRSRFIRTIFQQDEGYYTVVMQTLNSMTTWKDASLYLQMFYQTSGLDPHLPDVVEFTDIIQLRYSLAPKT